MNCSDEALRLRRGADLNALPRIMGLPVTTGIIRTEPADFIVRESLAFELTGAGEHLYLLVRKTGQNTRWVAKQLAQTINLSYRAVGYAGLKDRHAITEQWFSLHLPGCEDPDPEVFAIDGVEVLEQRRHVGKLRVGALRGNQFRIVIRNLDGDCVELERRLSVLRDGLLPNYFGAQRFGRGAGNLGLFGDLERPAKLKRESRSFALSALRSALFNNYLAQRISDGSAATALPGEIVYDEVERTFRHEPDVRGQSLQPTGLLWGAGENRATDKALECERSFFTQYPATIKLLESQDLRMMRRPLLIRPRELEWQVDDQQMIVSFTLARGQFATALLREFVTWPE
ncbi:MAG: tRNA pseudouridine(13) synthase TruD [Gammaproteobacteria bacterium]|jgi:tRNA pseudouridine13 synthase|nr:tRNA pseudouridine(13) synthase TruD [Chromatiales bacterium]MDP6675572.1 tRNA pseudouridine(13) synthase TruD [Gammaproteobacteria bacterium]